MPYAVPASMAVFMVAAAVVVTSAAFASTETSGSGSVVDIVHLSGAVFESSMSGMAASGASVSVTSSTENASAQLKTQTGASESQDDAASGAVVPDHSTFSGTAIAPASGAAESSSGAELPASSVPTATNGTVSSAESESESSIASPDSAKAAAISVRLTDDGSAEYPSSVFPQFDIMKDLSASEREDLQDYLTVAANHVSGGTLRLKPLVVASGTGTRIILLPPSTFQPGTYHLVLRLPSSRGVFGFIARVTGFDDGDTVFDGNVRIGTRIWNTDRDAYVVGETLHAGLSMNDPRPCSDERMLFKDPTGMDDQRTLTGSVRWYCGESSFSIPMRRRGTYSLKVSDAVETEVRRIQVADAPLVRFSRSAPTFVRSGKKARMTLTVLPSSTVIGVVSDRLPYRPVPDDPTATVERSGDDYVISWEKRYQGGTPMDLSYEFETPSDVTESLLLIGPASMRGYLEGLASASSAESASSSSVAASASSSSNPAETHSSTSSLTQTVDAAVSPTDLTSSSSEAFSESLSSEQTVSSESPASSENAEIPSSVENEQVLQSFLFLPVRWLTSVLPAVASASDAVVVTEGRRWQTHIIDRSGETSVSSGEQSTSLELTPVKDLFEAKEAPRFRLLDIDFDTGSTLTKDGHLRDEVAETKVALASMTDDDLKTAVVSQLVQGNSDRLALELTQNSETFNVLKALSSGRRSAVQDAVGKELAKNEDLQNDVAAMLKDDEAVSAVAEKILNSEVREAVAEAAITGDQTDAAKAVQAALREAGTVDPGELLARSVKENPSIAPVIAKEAKDTSERSGIFDWVSGTETNAPQTSTIRVELRDKSGRIFSPKYHFEKGSVILVLEPERSFAPGLYTIEITVTNPISGAEQTLTQDFAWGVLAMNPDKDHYVVGDMATIDVGVLDDVGEIVCDADLSIIVRSPSGTLETLSTLARSIVKTGTCGIKQAGFIEPDFTTTYVFREVGDYHMELTAATKNGERSISSAVRVLAKTPFLVHRTAATRLWPFAPSPMTIDVSFGEGAATVVEEKVPEGFVITSTEPKSTIIKNHDGTQSIFWKGIWPSGSTATFSYDYDAPDISPQFYLLGPLKIYGDTPPLSAR